MLRPAGREPALVPFCLLFGAALFFALRIEKIKKQYDVQTYREVAAFLEGKTLDEIQQLRESGKRPYQNIIKVLAGAAVGILLAAAGTLFCYFLP